MSKNYQLSIIKKIKKDDKKKLAKGIKIVLNRKRKKKQYGHEHYKTLAEDEKNRPVEYSKKIIVEQEGMPCLSTLGQN